MIGNSLIHLPLDAYLWGIYHVLGGLSCSEDAAKVGEMAREAQRILGHRTLLKSCLCWMPVM